MSANIIISDDSASSSIASGLGECASANGSDELAGKKKTCPICSAEKLLKEFGVCQARKDGRNLYCMSCIRTKVTESRRALKEYRAARKLAGGKPPGKPAPAPEPSLFDRLPEKPKLTPTERVRDAIKRGYHVAKDIEREAKLSHDECGVIIANFLLRSRELRSELVEGERYYYLNDRPALADASSPASLPQRKPDMPATFSSLEGLMPGKRRDKSVRLRGWIAS